jgi:acetyl esterase/lipase
MAMRMAARGHYNESVFIRVLSALLILAWIAAAQQAPLPIQDAHVLPLWSGPAPGALGSQDSDIPAVTVFLPRTMTPNTPAIVVCPGGGYVNLAMNHEGRQVAGYLNSLGIAAFVLRSRLGAALPPSD